MNVQSMTKKQKILDATLALIAENGLSGSPMSLIAKKADVVLSDMAANTTGNKDMDSFRTGDLCLKAMDLSSKILSINGIFLSKIFMGSVFSEINKKANKLFSKVVQYKPISSKSESKEIYIFCKGILKM